MTSQADFTSFLVFSTYLFLSGLLGIIYNFKNYLVTMMSVELMYLGAISSFVFYGSSHSDSRGAVYGLLTLILAACESAIGLGLLIVLYRFGRSIDFSAYELLHGLSTHHSLFPHRRRPSSNHGCGSLPAIAVDHPR